jgi:hypothetical protein
MIVVTDGKVKQKNMANTRSRERNHAVGLLATGGGIESEIVEPWTWNKRFPSNLSSRPGSLVGLLAFGPNLNFPLTVGKQWDRHYKIPYYGSRKEISRKITYEVKGIEQVTTTAGTFKAFKLESDDRASPRDYWVSTYWYSPETKSIVKSQFDSTSGGQETGLKRDIELIKFTPLN